MPVHVLVEVLSVLTRLPGGRRLPPVAVTDARHRLANEPIGLPIAKQIELAPSARIERSASTS